MNLCNLFLRIQPSHWIHSFTGVFFQSQPVPHNWYTKDSFVCFPVFEKVEIKDFMLHMNLNVAGIKDFFTSDSQ